MRNLYYLKFIVALLTLWLLSGCATYVQTEKLTSVSKSKNAIGLAYSLPELAFDVSYSAELKSCVNIFQNPIKAIDDPANTKKQAFYDLEVTVEVTPVLVSDSTKRYVIDFDQMSKAFSGTDFNVEFYPSGAIKSINSVVTDETFNVIGDVIKGYVAIQTGGGSLAAQQRFDAQETPKTMMADAESAGRLDDAQLKELKRILMAQYQETAMPLCNQSTLINLQKKLALEVEIKRFSLLIETLNVNSHFLSKSYPKGLKKICVNGAAGSEECADVIIDGCKNNLLKSGEILTCRDLVLESYKMFANAESEKLAKLIKKHLTISSEKRILPRWTDQSPVFERTLLNIGDPSIAKKWFDLTHEGSMPTDVIRLLVATEKNSRCDCLDSQCKTDRPIDLTKVEGDPATEVQGRNEGKPKGIVYRVPAIAHMTITHEQSGVLCKDHKLLVDKQLSLPQAGDLLVLPVHNKRFENKTISASFSELGIPQSFKYISKADAKQISGSLLGSAEAVADYKTTKKKSQISDINFEKSLVEAEMELNDAKAALINSQKELDKATNIDDL